MAIAKVVKGNWTVLTGTASEVAEELNVLNANPERVISGGNNAGAITVFLKQN